MEIKSIIIRGKKMKIILLILSLCINGLIKELKRYSMKKKLIVLTAAIIILISMLVSISAQDVNMQKNSSKGNLSVDSTISPTVLKIKIKNATGKELALIYNDKRQKASLDAEGNFTFSLELYTPDYAELDFEFLNHKHMKIFLLPGKSLSLTCDASDLNGTALFTGNGATENSGLLLLQAQYAQINYGQLFYGSDSTQFVALLQTQQMKLEKTLNDYTNIHPGLNSEFRKFEKARIIYWEASTRIKRSDSWGDRQWNLVDFTSKVDFNVNDPSLLGIDTYADFLNQYIKFEANQWIASDSALRASINQRTEAQYDVIIGTVTNQKIRNALLYHVLRIQLTGDPAMEEGPLGCKGIEELMTRFNRDCTDKILSENINQLYHQCQEGRNAPIIKVYKTVGTTTLDAHIFPASGVKPDEKRPTYLFFHGGGWRLGMPEWGYGECKHYSELGMVGISFEYRIMFRHGTFIKESVEDAKSAVRWVRSHADELGVDPNKIVIAGFSAGGHLAAAAGMVPDCDDPEDDKTVSAAPNAMVLMSAAVDYPPIPQIRTGLPPSIVFHGLNDQLCRFSLTEAFCNNMKNAGNRCELITFKGGHFRSETEWAEINNKTDEFLKSLGFLDGAQAH
jgi:acetyl esterase/lipase